MKLYYLWCRRWHQCPQMLKFCVKVLRPSLLPNSEVDFVHVWFDDRYWYKDRPEKLPKSKMADRGSKAYHPVLDEELMSLTDRRHRAVGVLMRELLKEAKKITKQQKITTFGSSINWVYVTICLFVAIPTSRTSYQRTTKISCSTVSASSSARERILTTTYHRSAMLTRHHWRLTWRTTLRSTPRVPSPSSWTRPEMKRTASLWCWPVQQMAGNYHLTSYSSRRRSRKSRGRRKSLSIVRTKGGWTTPWGRTGSRQFGANNQVA